MKICRGFERGDHTCNHESDVFLEDDELRGAKMIEDVEVFPINALVEPAPQQRKLRIILTTPIANVCGFREY